MGDRVSHPTLGQGKIVAIHYPEKPAETNLEIAFNGSDKPKTLKLMFVQENSRSLTKPRRFGKTRALSLANTCPRRSAFLLCLKTVEVALFVACFAGDRLDRHFPENYKLAACGIVLFNGLIAGLRNVPLAKRCGYAMLFVFIRHKRNMSGDDGRGVIHRKVFWKFIGSCLTASDPDD